jgi:hypothetical protein
MSYLDVSFQTTVTCLKSAVENDGSSMLISYKEHLSEPKAIKFETTYATFSNLILEKCPQLHSNTANCRSYMLGYITSCYVSRMLRTMTDL